MVSSDGDVGDSEASFTADLESASATTGSFPGFASTRSGELQRGALALRWMISGGGAGRVARPEASPMLKRVLLATNGSVSRSLRKRRAQPSQNRRLVQGYQ